MPQSEELVGQGDLTLDVPRSNGDTFTASVWGNDQLSNSSGGAAFSDGHGGDFSELDVTARYSAQVDEVRMFGGVVHYAFPDLVGRSTTELFAGVTFDGWTDGLTHTAMLYFDVDQADDYYATYGLDWTHALDERFQAAIGGQLGLMSDGQAELYFGRDRTGLSDATLTGQLEYQLDDVTHVWAKAGALVVPDAGLRDADDDRGFPSSAMVFTIGVRWSF